MRDPAGGAWFRRLFTAAVASRVSGNVVLLGLTSLFTDISAEMVTAVLPLYFMVELQMTPLQVGLIDGLYQGTSALVRVAAGVVADTGTRYKAVASFGYALSAVCKIGLVVAGSAWSTITALILVDRLGKGIRTAPRDALIASSSEPAHLGEAFGVHRALDTVGAIVGPLMAFGILALAPDGYRAVFMISFVVAIIGLAVIMLLVENKTPAVAPRAASGERPLAVLRNADVLRIVGAGALLGALTATDALIFLLIQRRGAMPTTFFPLLFVGMAGSYFLLALPFGRLADRIGRHRMFLAGHLAVLAVYGLLLAPSFSTASMIATVALLGAYYAATDGVLPALATTRLPSAQLSTGLAVVATAAALARLLAASLFGALWTLWQASGALIAFAAALVVATMVAAALLRVDRPWAGREEPVS